MTTILQFIEKAGLAGVFDDHATEVMGEAFDAARKDLHDTGQPDLVYEVVATRIIEAANLGERDPVVRPIEHKCPECNGTGFEVVDQPGRPGIRIYPARCKKCLGKGSIAN